VNVAAYSIVEYVTHFNSDYKKMNFHFMQYPLTCAFQEQRPFCNTRNQCRYIETSSPFIFLVGHAIAQVVSLWLPTAAARVRARVRSCRICGGQIGTKAGFLRVRLFMPIFIPQSAPQSSSSSVIWGWYNRPQYQVDSVSPH
jgi:hypothetical protein